MPEVLSVQNLAFQLMLTIRSKKRCPSRQMLPLIIRDMPATLSGKDRALQSMWMSKLKSVVHFDRCSLSFTRACSNETSGRSFYRLSGRSLNSCTTHHMIYETSKSLIPQQVEVYMQKYKSVYIYIYVVIISSMHLALGIAHSEGVLSSEASSEVYSIYIYILYIYIMCVYI